MDSELTPPKRITRARAAKATSSATSGTAASTAKSKATSTAGTAIAKAKTSRAAATTTVADSAPIVRKSAKRKARDDEDDESEAETATVAKRPPPASRTATRATRGPGRPKKTADPEPTAAPVSTAPAAPRTRGRPAKKPATESATDKAPVRATRTRAKKTQADEVDGDDEEDDLAPEAVKKARGRPAGTATTSASAPSSKPKKTVTFAEPDKENVVPITGARKRAAAATTTKPAEAPATTGMRAKPVRKPAGTGRSARTTATKKPAKETGDKKKASMPLSPKKVSQLSANRDTYADSEDELAMDRAPARPFHRSPVKPTGALKRPNKMQDEATGEEDTVALPPADSTTLLGSPVRRPPQSTIENSMRSPAKRIDGLHLGLSASQDTTKTNASPFKASLLQSPAKRMPIKSLGLDPFSSSHEQIVDAGQSSAAPSKGSLFQSPAKRMPIKSFDLDPFTSSREQIIASPIKQSLLQSPAKRGFSPFKPTIATEPEEPVDGRSPAPTPVLLCSPPAAEENEEVADAEQIKDMGEPEMDNDDEHQGSPSRTDFNGRMSTLLPREVDPALDHESPMVEALQDEECETIMLEEDSQEHVEIFEDQGHPMDVDEPELPSADVAVGDVSTTPPNSPPQETLAMFGLREKDLIPFDTTYSESEDEITRVMTPRTVSPTKSTRASAKRPRTSGLGFTPLARRFDEWQARSPLKPETPKNEESFESKQDQSELKDSLTKNTFFDDEMCARQEDVANESANDTDPLLSTVPEIKDPVVEDISITEEDLDLAAEANEMSVMSPDQVESMLNLDGNDDSISEASQEYGDENEVPGQYTTGVSVPPVTPQRRMRREVHTVSKIPLKAADESTPPPQPSLKKRRHSVSRVQVSRPTYQMSRSATVISYSPNRTKQVDTTFEEAAVEESFHERSRSLSPPETPSRSDAWLNAETPGRTPRRDVNPMLLRGAVVFVDVHTVEGADASALFVELLTQMGARCAKTWHWNPSAEDASSKIGITHVLFKDGGKRTMEKVRETGGAVHCVGVGWVLDCERENQWLDEAPYYIDTSLIPRGGARRRKSMEPKALANLNGTLVPNTAPRDTARECQTAPTTPAPANRRDSGLWIRSPDGIEPLSNSLDFDQLGFDLPGDEDWYNTAPLTPVPKTPAPEAIHRFAMEIAPDTPTTQADDEENVGIDDMMSREHLIQQTCPPKAQHMFQDLGAGILGMERDHNVARRLMDARRKSLAFAPKVSSPLARSSWKDWN